MTGPKHPSKVKVKNPNKDDGSTPNSVDPFAFNSWVRNNESQNGRSNDARLRETLIRSQADGQKWR